MYRKKDLNVIIDNLSKIKAKAKLEHHSKSEPTIEEMNSIYDIIKEYVKKKNRIIYGGYAQNALIKKKNKNNSFYEKSDFPDIEFYSYEPIKDMMELCDILAKKKYKHVEGKEGVHNETYSVFVNFKDGAYCDISYMPKNIFDRCETIMVEGMRMTHPYFMLTDAYRVYTDPRTSYWRLAKTFERFNLLIGEYPFNKNILGTESQYSINLEKSTINNILRFIRKNIFHNNKLIVVGHYAYNRLLKKVKEKGINAPFYQAISIDYTKDVKNIYNILKEKYGDDISFKEFTHFFQFLDKRINFYYKNQLILTIFGNNERCITYKYSKKKKTFFGNFQLIILYLLIFYNLAIIRRDNFDKNMYLKMIVKLLFARNKYLDRNNKTVLSKSPFEEFSIQCLGEPIDQLRKSRLEGLKRIKNKKPIRFTYRPQEDKEGKAPDYKFRNSSGNEIIKDINMTIKK